MESSTFEIKVATSLSKHILFCFQELERNSGPSKYLNFISSEADKAYDT